MSLQDWYNCLNGTSSARYNWGAGYVDASVRLEVLAMIEEEILGQYYSIPYSSGVTSALLGAKFAGILNVMLCLVTSQKFVRVNDGSIYELII